MRIAPYPRSHVAIAGVPWPVYKLVALVTAGVSLLVIGAVTASASAAVLTAAGLGTAVWLALSPRHRPRYEPGGSGGATS